MRIRDVLYFSPKYKFSQLNWDDKDALIKAFEDRVKGFYLEPAEKLNENKCGFASGLLCVVTIDFLARIATGKEKVKREDFEKWLKDNIEEFNDQLATKFYKDFRCGLVHEGRIKNCGQFSYESKNLAWSEGKVMIVNPRLLLERIEKAFESYINKIQIEDSAFQNFKNALNRDFKNDFELARKSIR